MLYLSDVVDFLNTRFQTAKQASIKEKRILHKKLRAKAKAKQAAKGTSQSQDDGVKESPVSEPLDKAKPRKAGTTTGTKEIVKKGQRKAPSSKPLDVKQSDASPQRPLEPQKKKRKTQKDHTATPASPRAPPRSQEKHHGKSKTPREKERKRAKALE